MLKSTIARVSCVLLLMAFALGAQDQPPPPLLHLARVDVKFDRADEWREITKRFSQAYENGGGEFRHVWRNRFKPHQYIVVTPLENYAALDRAGAAQQEISEAERVGLIARRKQVVENVEITIRRPIPELHIPWASGDPPPMLMTITIHVRPGMNGDFIDHQKPLVDAVRETDFQGLGVHRLVWGGQMGTFVAWSALEKMADLDSEARRNLVRSSMGEEAAGEWFAQLFSLQVAPSEWNIWVYEPDLSFHPAQ